MRVLRRALLVGAVPLAVILVAGVLGVAEGTFNVGIVTTVLAAPYFLLLLQRANRLGATG